MVGDAGGMTPSAAERTLAFVQACVIPAVLATGAVVVTGGTDAGVMAIVGHARWQARADFALIGVAPAGCVDLDLPPRPAMAAPEPHHTDLVLIPGDRFGDECAPLMSLAGQLAGDHRVVVLVIGGGAVTCKDVEAALAEGHTIAALSQSGGVASSLIAATDKADDGGARYLKWAQATLRQQPIIALSASTAATELVQLLTGVAETS